jgi:hypothetical protein
VRASFVLEVGPPLEHAAVAAHQRDIQLRLEILRAAPLELQVAIPRHVRDRAMEEGMRVVQEAGPARILRGLQAAAGNRAAL